jgi:hypothetical protein
LPEALEPGATSVVLEERALDDLLDGLDIVEKPSRTARSARIH